MTKTIQLDNDVHERLKDIQDIIRDNTKMRISLQEIVDTLIGNPEESAIYISKKKGLNINRHD